MRTAAAWHRTSGPPTAAGRAPRARPPPPLQPPPPPLLLLGFDFFKEIDGKIHYMEDECKANHHASQEEHCCMDLCKAGQLAFLVRRQTDRLT